jgi:hypothetical protein
VNGSPTCSPVGKGRAASEGTTPQLAARPAGNARRTACSRTPSLTLRSGHVQGGRALTRRVAVAERFPHNRKKKGYLYW